MTKMIRSGKAVKLSGQLRPFKKSAEAIEAAPMFVCAKVRDLKGAERWAIVAYFGDEKQLREKIAPKADKRNRIVAFLEYDQADAMDALTEYHPSGSKAAPNGHFANWSCTYDRDTKTFEVTVINDRRYGKGWHRPVPEGVVNNARHAMLD